MLRATGALVLVTGGAASLACAAVSNTTVPPTAIDPDVGRVPEPPAPEEPKLPDECEPPPKAAAIDPDFEFVRREIEEIRLATGVASIAVAVARGGTILWEEGFGWANRARRIRATEHTTYSLASISKPMTATALMVLVERGQIILDRPINDYLGDSKLWGEGRDLSGATVERVATHTSGLPLHYQFFYADDSFRPRSPDHTVARYGALVTEPGERFHYSNLGYGILGEVIARVSGKSYPELMRDDVFDPLGMTNSSIHLDPKLKKLEAIRYRADGRQIPRYEFDHDGASAAYASAHDLVRFGMFHLGDTIENARPILTAESRERMRKPLDPSKDYALGWGVGRFDGMETFAHTGGMPGVRTILRGFVDQDVAVVVLSNGDSLGGRAAGIVTALVVALELPSRSDDVCKLGPDHALIGTWRGSAHLPGGERKMSLKIAATGDLHVQLGDEAAMRVHRVSFRDETVRGVVFADIGAEQARPGRSRVTFELKLRDGRLDGGVTARSPTKGARTHFVALRRD